MMEVIKVIVDELPKNCVDCWFGQTLSYDPNDDFEFIYHEYCLVMDKNNYDRSSCPDWCPLVDYDESSERIEELERLVESYGDIIARYCVDNDTYIVGFND
jgi:hypothetical protein